MNAIIGYLRLAPLMVVLVLAVAGCSLELNSQDAKENSGNKTKVQSRETKPEPSSQQASKPAMNPEIELTSQINEANTSQDNQGYSGDHSGDSDTIGATSPSDDGEKASLRQAVGDYYRAAGAEKWSYTYDHLASQTKSRFTEEKWSRKNQWFWNSNPTTYHILSTRVVDTSGKATAEVELRITGEDGPSWTRTTYFVMEDGEWKHRFSEAETDLFMPDATFEEFVEAQADTSSESTPEPTANGVCDPLPGDAQDPDCLEQQETGFEQFVGEWYRHGEIMTINSDKTGSGASRIYSKPSGEICPPDGAKCNVEFELSFTATDNGVRAEITSLENEEYLSQDLEVGDSWELTMVEDNLLRQSNRGEVGGYWCNSQTSPENRECGA